MGADRWPVGGCLQSGDLQVVAARAALPGGFGVCSHCGKQGDVEEIREEESVVGEIGEGELVG